MTRKTNKTAQNATVAKTAAPAIETTPVEAVAVVAKTRKTKPPQIVTNGVPAPREGTVGHKLWALADDVAKGVEGGYKQIRLAVIQAAGDDYNPGNVRTELSLWRRNRGIAK